MPRQKTFKKNNRKGKGSDRDAVPPGTRGNYSAIPSENALYESYYRELGVIPPEEFDAFWAALKRTLPTTFRFTGSKGHALTTMKTLAETHVPHLRGVEWDGEMVQAPEPIPWYPDNLAWSTTVGKSTIRRCPPFKKFQQFLVAETTVGNISRQEAVSMIPPLLMDVQPDHKVLDMCAAPGSKTAQLIEMIHAGEEQRIAEAVKAGPSAGELGLEGDQGGRSEGIVIANDADYKRSHMLIHQTKRLNSPNIIVTNHDATMFPSLIVSEPGAEKKEYLKFDRILTDVPCSGDGTARKNYSVWRDWNPNGAFNLHLTQVRILVRGLQMLKTGGRIIYSTCSMNPVENEAVVAEAIDRCGGREKVDIIDVSDKLPNLKRRPGLKGGWRVMDKDGKWYSNWDEVSADTEGREGRMSRMVKSMFCSEHTKSDDDETRVPLERCIRVYPHLQDTGGFFIVVLEKKKDIGAVKNEEGGRRKLAAIARAIEKKNAGEDVEVPTLTEADTAPEEVPEILELTPEQAAVQPTPELAPKTEEPAAPSSPSKRKAASPPPEDEAAKKPKTEDNVPATETPAASTPAETPARPLGAPRPKQRGIPLEEPFKFLPPTHPVLSEIFEFYGLSPRFPRTNFMVRNADATPARAIYFTSPLARRILEANEGKGVKFVHCGVKAFMKQDVQSPETCRWRIQNEGLGLVAPWIGEKRVVRAKKRETVHALLRELFPKVNAEEEAAAKKAAEEAAAKGEGVKTEPVGQSEQDRKNGSGFGVKLSSIGEIEERVRDLSMGCCVLKIEKDQEGCEFSDDMVLPLWRSRHSCNLMLPKDERKAMLMRLFDDESEVLDSTNKNKVGSNKVAEAVEEAKEIADVQVKDEEGILADAQEKEEVGEKGDEVMTDA